MEKPRAEIDDDLKVLKISNPIIAQEEPTVQITENLVNGIYDYDPEEELKEKDECAQGQDIAKTIIPKIEEKTDESNEEISVNENVQFKKSGKRTTSKRGNGKIKGKKTACYGNFTFGGF